MNTNTFLTCFLIYFGLECSTILAQQNTVATGGNGSGAGGSVSYSIGQIDHMAPDGSDGNVNQGVQQPYEFYVVGIDGNSSISLEITAYPNPTNSKVSLKVGDATIKNLFVQLHDINGKLLSKEPIRASVTDIPMERLPSASYLLYIRQGETLIKTIKIIKK